MDVSVYFKPDCTNCQTTQGLLQARGIDAHYVRYLEDAPSTQELERVMGMLGTDDPREIIREKEPVYAELGLASASRDELLEAMTKNPILIQRPIVIVGDRAVIARPPERMLALLDE
ncbi:MAG: arsenate reductase (glutaredoxin) [Actinomycetota bacterium]|nr:arsenate reductase (glutaredoxin) [Actinomycetota bacterium]